MRRKPKKGYVVFLSFEHKLRAFMRRMAIQKEELLGLVRARVSMFNKMF
jgi:hypothetical protein